MKRFGKKIYFYIGTTAELIKLAPIIKELKNKKVGFKIITSGQTKVHFDQFDDYFGKVRADIAFPQKINKSSAFIFIWWAFQAFVKGLVVI